MSHESPSVDRNNSQELISDSRLYPALEKLCTFKGTVQNVPGRNAIGQVLRTIVPNYDHKMEYRQLPDLILNNVDAMRFLGDKSGLRRLNVDTSLHMPFWDTCNIENGIATFYQGGVIQGTCNLAPESIRLQLQHFNNKPAEEINDDAFSDVNKVVSRFIYREGQDPLAMILDSLHVSADRAEKLTQVILRKGSQANRWLNKDFQAGAKEPPKPEWHDGMIVDLKNGHLTIWEKDGSNEVGSFKLITNEAVGNVREKEYLSAHTYVNKASLAGRTLLMDAVKKGKKVINIDDKPAYFEGPKESAKFPMVDGNYILGSKDFDKKIPESGADFYKEIGSSRITISASHRRASGRVDPQVRDAVWDSSDTCYKYTDGKKEKVTFWNNYYYEIKAEPTYNTTYIPDDTTASKKLPRLSNADLEE